MIDSRGLAKSVGNGWWESFCRRHPNLTLRSAAPLSQGRAVASDPDTLQRYFDLLEQTIDENGLRDKPAQIFNVDESGMPLDPKPPLVICTRGAQHPCSIGSGNKAQITIVACVSAAGMCIPPW